MKIQVQFCRSGKQGSVLGKLMAWFLPLAVIAGGVALAVGLVKTSPKAERKPPPRLARLVETREVHFGAQATPVLAYGTVQPAREVTLYPRVSGEVISLSGGLIPGRKFEAGATLVQIDPSDFELALRQAQTDLNRAKATLAMEMGQQAVALREYELLGETVSEESRDLVLRKPHLAQAQAAVEAAEAALQLAQLNLDRTSIKAPFNCTVRNRNINVGSQVTPATALARVTGTDEFWVELTVSVDQLKWIRVPHAANGRGSTVRLRSETSRDGRAVREGSVLELLPDLEPNGRLARLLVSVPDPLAILPENEGKPALILGDYVRAEIQGVGIPQAVALERSLFRDGDNVWVMTPENRLQIRPVQVAFRGPEQLLVTSGLAPGEKLVITELPAAVEGMALRTAGDATAQVGEPVPLQRQENAGPRPGGRT